MATLTGINTSLRLGSAIPTADAVAVAATLPPNYGIVRIPGPGLTGTGVLAVAVSNVGWRRPWPRTVRPPR